jgi:hypothetical protein
LQLASTDTTKDSDVYNYLTAPTSAKRGATPLLAPLLAGEIRPFIDAGYLVENEVFPIELLYFTGAIKGEDGMLKWETTSEINASHFLVERSFDGFVLDRSNISQIPTKGNEKKRTVYAATDRGVGLLNIEKVWYRLKMVDIDGTYTYSNVVELNLDQTKPDIYVFEYPNPAKDVVYVDYQLFAAKYGDIKVVNAMGQTMYSQALDASNTMTQLEIRTSDWASGVYFIEIYTDNAKAIRKIVIE